MSRFSIIILVLIAFVCASSGLNSAKCQLFPKEKHCLIEYMAQYRWPHTVRYVYNWYIKSCFEIRWSDNCPPVASPAINNNFSTERECLQQCGGWA